MTLTPHENFGQTSAPRSGQARKAFRRPCENAMACPMPCRLGMSGCPGARPAEAEHGISHEHAAGDHYHAMSPISSGPAVDEDERLGQACAFLAIGRDGYG